MLAWRKRSTRHPLKVKIAGSNPAASTNAQIVIVSVLMNVRPYRLMARISPFQGEGDGSEPSRVT